MDILSGEWIYSMTIAGSEFVSRLIQHFNLGTLILSTIIFLLTLELCQKIPTLLLQDEEEVIWPMKNIDASTTQLKVSADNPELRVLNVKEMKKLKGQNEDRDIENIDAAKVVFSAETMSHQRTDSARERRTMSIHDTDTIFSQRIPTLLLQDKKKVIWAMKNNDASTAKDYADNLYSLYVKEMKNLKGQNEDRREPESKNETTSGILHMAADLKRDHSGMGITLQVNMLDPSPPDNRDAQHLFQSGVEDVAPCHKEKSEDSLTDLQGHLYIGRLTPVQTPFEKEFNKLNITSRSDNCDRQGNASSKLMNDSQSTNERISSPHFSKVWQTSKTFSTQGGQLQGKDSDVVLYVPENAIEASTEVTFHCAISTDLQAVHKELVLSAEETIASPIVEYSVGNYNGFQKALWVILPHFLTKSYSVENVRVYWFQKDNNGSFVVQRLEYMQNPNLPNISKQTKCDNACYFFMGNKICVLAPHFSGFFCTQCRRDLEPFYLEMCVYGTHRYRDNREVNIALFAWDGRLQIKDFEKDVLKGQDKQLKMITNGQLAAAPNDKGVALCMKMIMPETTKLAWKHLEMEGHQVYENEKVVSLESMYVPSDLGQSECHHQGSKSFCRSCFYNRKPARVDWALEEKFGTKPSAWFRCAIQVGYIRAFETKGLQFITEVKMETLHIRGLEVEVKVDASIQTDTDDKTFVKKLCEAPPSNEIHSLSIEDTICIKDNETSSPASKPGSSPPVINFNINKFQGQLDLSAITKQGEQSWTGESTPKTQLSPLSSFPDDERTTPKALSDSPSMQAVGRNSQTNLSNAESHRAVMLPFTPAMSEDDFVSVESQSRPHTGDVTNDEQGAVGGCYSFYAHHPEPEPLARVGCYSSATFENSQLPGKKTESRRKTEPRRKTENENSNVLNLMTHSYQGNLTTKPVRNDVDPLEVSSGQRAVNSLGQAVVTSRKDNISAGTMDDSATFTFLAPNVTDHLVNPVIASPVSNVDSEEDFKAPVQCEEKH